MKLNFISRSFAFILYTVIFALPIVAQKKPDSILVDEITAADAKDAQIVAAKIENFLERLAKEPRETRGYIDTPINTVIGEKLKSLVDKNATLKNRVLFWGKLRSYPRFLSSLETGLFLVPNGADIPFRCIIEPCECPEIKISHSIKTADRDSILIFEVTTRGGDVENISYQWKISAGKIISGQGTREIEVDATGTSEAIATVEVKGILCEECPREASSTVKIEH